MIEPPETVEAHDVLDLRTELVVGQTVQVVTETTQIRPIFDLERMWHRGRFRPSLLAVSAERSELWRAQYSGQGLPLLPPLRKTARLAPDPWRWLAFETVGRSATYRSEAAFRRAISSAFVR